MILNDINGSNEAIANHLKNTLLWDNELENALRSQTDGFVNVFIRNGTVQKISFCQLNFGSSSSQIYDEEVVDDKEPQILEVPRRVYMTFCYLFSAAISTLKQPIVYGEVKCTFRFKETGDEWEHSFDIDIIREIHFDGEGNKRMPDGNSKGKNTPPRS